MKAIIQNTIILIGVGVVMFLVGNYIQISTKEKDIVWNDVKLYDDLNFDHVKNIRTVKTLSSGRPAVYILIYGNIIVPSDKKLIKIPIRNLKDMQDILACYFGITEKIDLDNLSRLSSCYIYGSHGIFALVSEEKSLVFLEMRPESVSGSLK